MRNQKIRKAIENAGLRYWEVAEAVGVHPVTLSMWLRQPLTGNRLERVQAAIDKLSAEKKGGVDQ